MSDKLSDKTATVGEKTYNAWNLNGLSRDEIKKIALQAHTERNSSVNRSWLGSLATKQTLINFILGEPIDDSMPVANGASFAPAPQASVNSADPMAVLANAIAPHLPSAQISPEAITQAVDAHADSFRKEFSDICDRRIRERCVHTVVIENRITGAIENLGLCHERFPALLKRIQTALAMAKHRVFLNIWLVGPAGSGKTTAIEKAAEALGMNFEFNGALDSEHKLLGFVDAHGRIVYRPFRNAWENGGIYLFDEVDASMPGACLALNAALANGFVDFPDKRVNRHENFVCLASGNVWQGATEEYVGRYKPDAAFADRFSKFAWPYDEALERALALRINPKADAWIDYVQRVRRNAKAKGTKIVISPRASIGGAAYLRDEISWSECVDEWVKKGFSDSAIWAELEKAA